MKKALSYSLITAFTLTLVACANPTGTPAAGGSASPGGGTSTQLERGDVPLTKEQFQTLMDCLASKGNDADKLQAQAGKAAANSIPAGQKVTGDPPFYMPYKNALAKGCNP